MRLLHTCIVFLCFIQAGNAYNTRPLRTGVEIDTSLVSIEAPTLALIIDADSLTRSIKSEILNFYKSRPQYAVWIINNNLSEAAINFKNLLQQHSIQERNYVNCFLAVNGITKYFQNIPDSLKTDSLKLHTEIKLTGYFLEFLKLTYPKCYETAEKWFFPLPLTVNEAIKELLAMLPLIRVCNVSGEPELYKLSDKLSSYSVFKQNDSWSELVVPQKAFKSGEKNHQLVEIKRRVFLLLDTVQTDSSDVYTSSFQSKVKAFQQLNGLKEDGIIGREVITALNVGPTQRLEQLLSNIQRLKWNGISQNGDGIIINIPEFKMHVYQAGELCWSTAVVVGKPTSSTSVFTGDMKYIVFSPYWNVPLSIVRNEIIPEVKKDRGYIYKERLEFRQGNKTVSASSISWEKYPNEPFPYSVRQKPGPSNSLGLVKFLFPNEHDIYLHDTPAKSLFNSSFRSFSHGCIRISEPQKLAEHLLRNEAEWDSVKISSVMQGGKETWVTLKQLVPVSIVYRTVWVDEKGNLNFRRDIYKLDEDYKKLYLR
ncbi:L,D-transpeptidase family protein [Solitalea lacus]|uniref:L,D-transpeptidase family protein n=1 Tax=Solitalea lacus TaxID=2911172 RepID=UPI001EDB7319|nr:L,D-transpeptidase family protein [Solitalea lacus]UKJ08094.1 L,D-transpeptidase family protein [Solitalea lacus]